LITTDLGCDRLSVFSLGKSAIELATHTRKNLSPGSGPRHVVLHPQEIAVYVDHALEGAASGFLYDAKTGSIGRQCASAHGAFGDALAMHPRGEMLYSARKSELSVWEIVRATKALKFSQAMTLDTAGLRAITPLQDGSALLVLTGSGVIRMEVDNFSGRIGRATSIAALPGAISVAIG
jgi:6-phosphogluconolactonase (cycloisomerase 2 family)